MLNADENTVFFCFNDNTKAFFLLKSLIFHPEMVHCLSDVYPVPEPD